MTCFIWITTTTILTLHSTNGYVLLTANLDDVSAIAKQLSNSPLSDQLDKIWRRAAQQFNMYVNKDPNVQQRAHDDEFAPQGGYGYRKQAQPPAQSFQPDKPIVPDQPAVPDLTFQHDEPLPNVEKQTQVKKEEERSKGLEKIRTEDMVGYHGVHDNGDTRVYLNPKPLR